MSQPEIVKLWIRLAAGDKQRLEAEAERNRRSLTGEIAYRLLGAKACEPQDKAAR